MITIIPIEPLNQAHGTLIVAAFNRFFVNKGGQQDGWGYGYGRGGGRGGGGRGGGRGGGKIPEEWLINESSRQPADGHI